MINIESLEFDSDLFQFKVGRIEISDENKSQCTELALQQALQEAYFQGIKLVYIFSPTIFMQSNEISMKRSSSSTALYMSLSTSPRGKQLTVPGICVDDKITYELSLSGISKQQLVQQAFSNENVVIESASSIHSYEDLKKLSIAAGDWSRFKVDTNIPSHTYELMYEKWLENSLNKTLADEVFIAKHTSNDEVVGLITVKSKGSYASIGLLAVNKLYRRQGIAQALLSRVVLWTLEKLGWRGNNKISVITQGANEAACRCYEKFGFVKYSSQLVHHAWLPMHLLEPLSRSDRARLPFCKQHMTGKEIEYVSQVLSTGLDSAARFTNMCVTRLKDLLGQDSERVIIVPSGTAALEMAALLIDLKPGDEVIMPSYTFSSTANAVVLRGAVPVFVDIRIDTLNIDESLIEAAITARTKAIFCVHYAGIPCEMDEICSIASRHKLTVVEDAAQGFMSTYKGRLLGTIGDFGCFSFHYTKNVICGEGGAISINRSSELARRALVLWEKGTNRYDFMAGKIDKYEWVDVGSSYVPSEVSCAILYAQLEKCESISESRLEKHRYYDQSLRPLADKGFFSIATIPSYCQHNGHIFFIVLADSHMRIIVEEHLKSRGITAFSHYVPLHSSPAGKRFGKVGSSMDVTNKVGEGLLRLPIWIGLRLDELNYVIQAIHDISPSL